MDASDIQLPAGYSVEAVATGLTYPSAETFDEQGNVYVVESGYSYLDKYGTSKLLRVEGGGKVRPVAKGEEKGPWNGVAYRNGVFCVSEGNVQEGGRILKVTKDGSVTAIVGNLPKFGDHQTNGRVVGDDGYVYFGQGTATNSGVVGRDNYRMGWLSRNEKYHDILCQDVVLTGENYTADNFLTLDGDDKATTGAYVPFGTSTQPGQTIPGKVPCTGAVMRVRATGGAVELVAWGFRNPYGMAFSPNGRLFITENSFDARGSRPVTTKGDYLWEVKPGAWYGWLDYEGGCRLALMVTDAPERKHRPGSCSNTPNPAQTCRRTGRAFLFERHGVFTF